MKYDNNDSDETGMRARSGYGRQTSGDGNDRPPNMDDLERVLSEDVGGLSLGDAVRRACPPIVITDDEQQRDWSRLVKVVSLDTNQHNKVTGSIAAINYSGRWKVAASILIGLFGGAALATAWTNDRVRTAEANARGQAEVISILTAFLAVSESHLPTEEDRLVNIEDAIADATGELGRNVDEWQRVARADQNVQALLPHLNSEAAVP